MSCSMPRPVDTWSWVPSRLTAAGPFKAIAPGGDTDTVAACAGAIAGAWHGLAAITAERKDSAKVLRAPALRVALLGRPVASCLHLLHRLLHRLLHEPFRSTHLSVNASGSKPLATFASFMRVDQNHHQALTAAPPMPAGAGTTARRRRARFL